MITLIKEVLPIMQEPDVIFLRNKAKDFAIRIGMGLVGQTKLLTAASELVRNMLRYAQGGEAILEVVVRNNVKGVRLTFADKGPGIPDVRQAMQDGFTTGKSLGLGLPGAKRLSNEFAIKSEVGQGTTVTIIRWTNGV
jgi:serine/threonine-protein kinase RsbT